MKLKKIMLLAVFVVTVGSLIGTYLTVTSQTQSTMPQNVTERSDHFPTAICCPLDISESSVERSRKGKQYEKKIKLLHDKDTSGKQVVTFSHWDIGLPSLPVGRSELVVVGKVVDSSAYLTPNQTDVYSEFSIRVSQVLKNSGLVPRLTGDVVVATRRGGRVQYPSGRILDYVVVGQDMPRPQGEYIFFLERHENGYVILTGYKDDEGKIRPLDGSNAPKASRWEGDKYFGLPVSDFLVEVNQAVGNEFKGGITQ